MLNVFSVTVEDNTASQVPPPPLPKTFSFRFNAAPSTIVISATAPANVGKFLILSVAVLVAN